MKPRVSVVITTRNRRQFLAEAVASARLQCAAEVELIVVDDASSDGSWDWLAAQADLRAVRLDTNSQLAAARNAGLAVATSQLVWFLDDDDRLRPRALEALAAALQATPAAVAAVGALWRFGDGIDASRMIHPVRASTRRLWPELLAGWSAVPSQTLWRTEAVRRVGAFRADLFGLEDRDLWLRLARTGPACLVPEIVVEYRIHAGQMPRPPDMPERRERLYADAIASLPAAEQPAARRLRAAGRLWNQAERDREAGRPGRALVGCAAALWKRPMLFSSPLLWPAIGRSILYSLRDLLRA